MMKHQNTRKENLDILGLNNDATDDDIKFAYRKLAKKCHPDINSENPDSSKEFMKLKDAYDDLLKDKLKKVEIYTQSPPSRQNFGDFFDSIIKDFRERFNFTDLNPFDNFNETPEPFVDLRKTVRDKNRRKFFKLS